MKRLQTLILAFSLVAALLITGCSDGSSGGTENGSDNPGGSGDPVLSNVVKSGLKFDFSNAKAIAAVDKDSLSRAVYSRNARAIEDSPIDDSPLLKILENGSLESAITLAENANLATIKAIHKSPREGQEFLDSGLVPLQN